MSTRARQYWPALDGVRAVAIIAVVAYHLGDLNAGWAGVDLFFVLSGYLITTLLLAERRSHGRIALRAFWARRARRLLPAVLLVLIVLGVYAWSGGPGLVPAQFRAPALATLFYGANWQQIAAAHNYFAAFSAPTPLVHTWSLAVEEQYYLFWPVLVVAIGALAAIWARLRSREVATVKASGAPRALVVATVVLTGLSVLDMGLTAHLISVNRAYLGTDTRAWELLAGGLAAMVVPPVPSAKRPGRWAVATALGAVGMAVFIWLAGNGGVSGQPPAWVRDGGLFGAVLCALAVITGSLRAPNGPVAAVLALAPVRWLGRVSYSLYLWHWPVIDLVNPSTSGLTGPALLAVRLALMTAATCVSFYLVEGPLRRANWATTGRRLVVVTGIAGTAAVLFAATVTPALAGTGRLAATTGHGIDDKASQPGPMVPSPTRTSVVAVSASKPLRVWILGDSVMNDSSPGVTAALEATGRATVVANTSFGGWGLTTATTWPTDSERIIAQYHPQVIIGTWSWDNHLAEEHPKTYLALLRRAVALWLTPGDGVDLVVLLQFPQAGPSPYITDPRAQRQAWVAQTQSLDDWDAIAQKVVTEFPRHALYLLTAPVFAPGGRYFTWFRTPQGTWVRARKLDGAHMCPYGAASLGRLVVSDLGTVFALGTPKAGWQFGSWVSDPRYNDPPGACPADQPPAHYRGIAVPMVSEARPKKAAKG